MEILIFQIDNVRVNKDSTTRNDELLDPNYYCGLLSTTTYSFWAMQSKKRPYNSNGKRQVILQQDNITQKKLKTLSIYWTRKFSLTRLIYQISPSDYHLFRSLQHHLTDEHFKSSKSTVDEVQKSIDDFIELKLPSFLRNGICQFPEK